MQLSKYFTGLRKAKKYRLLSIAILCASLVCPGSLLAAPVLVNFQAETASLPAGYLRDFGQAYGLRTGANQSGSYGWVVPGTSIPLDATAYGRERGSSAAQRLDTLMHMQKGAPGAWEIELPNATYDVTIAVGDPSFYDSIHSLSIEGLRAISGFVPTRSTPFSEATVSVTVSDGRLSVVADGTNTKINAIAIHEVMAGAVCGNGALEEGEQCDDGNLADGDGCSASCTVESTPSNGLLDLTLVGNSGGWKKLQAITDGNPATKAHKKSSSIEWVEYALSSQRRISNARLNEDNAGNWNVKDWNLQYWTGSGWMNAFPLSPTPFAGWHEVDFDDVATQRVRLRVRADVHPEVAEFELYGQPETSCNDNDAGCLESFHLTARPWTPLELPRSTYLDRADAVVRNMLQYQDESGAIIDPNRNNEWQYSTPYFAAACAVLIDAGRYAQGSDIWYAALKAMDKASRDYSNGVDSIPQKHGEFYGAPLTTTYRLLSPLVDTSTAETWKTRLSVPVESVIRGATTNWRSYAMKGEWLRVRAGLVDESSAVPWLDSSWYTTQKPRISDASPNDLFLYHDGIPDPQTFAYDSVARMNIASMVDELYPGSARGEMLDFVRKGGETVVKFLDPTGQGGANGRSADHVWNDVVPGTVYERLAEAYFREGDLERAGRFRRAAMLTLKGTDRFRRHDCPDLDTNCAYSVTKNQFPSSKGVRYASYSAVTNYNGYMEYHQTESYEVRQSDIEEKPTWSEIGGYAFQTEDELAGAVVNAGGMHVQIALRGQTGNPVWKQWWTALGVSRFSRPDWDSRLGPSDGIRDPQSNLGITFAPTLQRNGTWYRMASIPEQYQATFSTSFVHPLLVRFQLVYSPTAAAPTGSPSFTQDFIVVPDGVYTTLTSSSNGGGFGTTFPILVDDGATSLATSVAGGIASTRYPSSFDEQNFIALGSNPDLTAEDVVRSGYGDLRAIRYTGSPNQAFVYPRKAEDPSAASVQSSFVVTSDGFVSNIAKVTARTYIGRTSAGGKAKSLDLDGDGSIDVSFDKTCSFVLQLTSGVVTAVETDAKVKMTYGNRVISFVPYTPVRL